MRSGQIYTPYSECGLLPGILRSELLRRELIQESLLPLQALDTCECLLMGNSLRSLYPVQSLEWNDGHTLTWATTEARTLIQRLEAVLFQIESQ